MDKGMAGVVVPEGMRLDGWKVFGYGNWIIYIRRDQQDLLDWAEEVCRED